MSQTTYSSEMTQAIAGLIADGFEPKIKSFAAEETIPFGLGVVAGTDLENTVQLPNIDQFVVFDADLVTGNLIDLDINGVAITQVPFNIDNITTLQNLATEIGLNANVESATVSGTNTIEVEGVVGVSIDITNAIVTGGAGQANVIITNTNLSPFRGVATLDQATQQDSAGDAFYALGQTVNTLTQGTVWVVVNGTVAPDDDVALVVADDSTKGRFVEASTVSDPNSQIAGAKFRSSATVGEIAKIEFNLPA